MYGALVEEETVTLAQAVLWKSLLLQLAVLCPRTQVPRHFPENQQPLFLPVPWPVLHEYPEPWGNKECHEAKWSVPYPTRNESPFFPNPLLLCLDRAMHFPALFNSPETSHMIHCKPHQQHTFQQSTTFTEYMNIKHGNLWRKIMVSFIFMKQVMSAWGASESPPSGAKQDTEQGLQSHLPTWNQMVGNITSFNALYSGKEDLTNSTIWHMAPLYQTAILMAGFPKKSEMSKFQIKANTMIEIFLLICHKISWLYIFQSSFQPYLPIIQKFSPVFKCSKLFKMLF